MIGELVRGPSFRGLFNYCFGEGKRKVPLRATLMAGSMAGSNPRELSREFNSIRALRPDIKKNVVYHVILSLAPGEHLADEEWAYVDDLVAQALHHDAHVMIRHNDTECDHGHYVGSAIRRDGTRAREHLREYARIEAVCREVEQKFGLRVVQKPDRSEGPHGRRKQESRTPKHREKDMERTSGEMSDTNRLAWRVKLSLKGAKCSLEWLRALESMGVAAIPNRKAGKVTGLTFVEQGIGMPIKGSTLKLPAAKIDALLGGTLSATESTAAWDAHTARAIAWKDLANSELTQEEEDHVHATEPRHGTRTIIRNQVGGDEAPIHDLSTTRGQRVPGGLASESRGRSITR